jgi:NSS family neurotransmitter:Na+ symporter
MARHGRQRETWRLRSGFVFAAIGSAAGLGNIWRFPHVTAEHGGAVFVMLYILFIILVAVPVIIAETAVGHRSRRSPLAAFQVLGRGTPWAVTGYLAIATVMVVLGYYSVVAGWTARYFFTAVSGTLWSIPASGYGDYFHEFVADGWTPVLWQAALMTITVMIVSGGVRGGIERCNRFMVPLLALILVAFVAFSMTLDGAAQGLQFLFKPDWTALLRPQVYLAALGQAFFSLGAGAGVYLTYGSYLPRRSGLARPALLVATGDTAFALLAALAIFPTLFTFGGKISSGPGLAFVTLPELFRAMPAGAVFGSMFFLLLCLAAVTSMVSMLEVVVASITRGGRRPHAAVIAGLAIFALGVPAALGFGPWQGVRFAGLGIFEAMDFAASNVALPIGGLLIATFVGWRWGRLRAVTAANLSGIWSEVWFMALRYLAPVAIVLVFLAATGII